MLREVDAARVVERGHVALEALGETAIDGTAGWAAAGAVVLGHEVVRALALVDVVAGGRDAGHALGKDTGHEERVVANVAADGDFALRLERHRLVIPDRLRLEEHVDDGFQPRVRHAAREERIRACEAGEEIGEIGGGGLIVHDQIVEGGFDRAIEESLKLHGRMITNLLEFEPVTDVVRARLPWTVVGASVLLALLLAYTLFAAYLPAKTRVARLERELKDLYAREADLQTRSAQNERRHALREQQLTAVSAERDALARRLEELEKELAAARRR